MTNVNKLTQPETREKLASAILHLLAVLPEAQKNMFVWKHYYGLSEAQIASRLGRTISDVEETLLEIRRAIFEKAQELLNESLTLQETDRCTDWYATCAAS